MCSRCVLDEGFTKGGQAHLYMCVFFGDLHEKSGVARTLTTSVLI
jgi:hypothetical protein